MAHRIPIEEVVKETALEDNKVERISFRKVKPPLDIVDPDPTWPSTYAIFASRIVAALGPPSSLDDGAGSGKNHLVSVSHIGSTSVPGLPAKAIIDIDVVVPDINDESAYVSALEAQGFQFMLRETWYSHRFFTATEPMVANIHVFGPACPEAERHRIFREWLLESAEDRDLYAKTKKECSEATQQSGETTQEYTERKAWVVKEILQRAFKRFGYIS